MSYLAYSKIQQFRYILFFFQNWISAKVKVEEGVAQTGLHEASQVPGFRIKEEPKIVEPSGKGSFINDVTQRG